MQVSSNGQAVEYTPADDFTGRETFTYTVSDGTGADTATVTVNLNDLNEAPTVSGFTTLSGAPAQLTSTPKTARPKRQRPTATRVFVFAFVFRHMLTP